MLTRFGSSLLYVRYCGGEAHRGKPDAGKRGSSAGGVTIRRVALRIGWREKDLQQRVKSAGGRWDPVRRVWLLRRDVAEWLDLMSRVVGGGGFLDVGTGSYI